jgi:hypothetical protein
VSVVTSLFGAGRIRAAKRIGILMATGIVAGVIMMVAGSAGDSRPLFFLGTIALVAGCFPLLFTGDLVTSIVTGFMRTIPRSRAAAAHGMQYSRLDPFGLDQVGFLGLGHGAAEHVAWGDLNGRPLVWFEWSKGLLGRKGNLACAAVDLGADCPPMLMGRAGSGLDEAELPKVELEAVEFNRAFVVACRDRRFATTFCDAALMAWLVDSFPADVFAEAHGRYVVCWTRMARGGSGFGFMFSVFSMIRGGWDRELDQVLLTGAELAGRVPKVVASLFPAAAQAGSE